MSDEIKFCKDCKYFALKQKSAKSAGVECTSPLGRTEFYHRDLVTGEKRTFSSSPWENRGRTGQCNVDAKYFEPSIWYNIKNFLRTVK
jgi:hypothetical protein